MSDHPSRPSEEHGALIDPDFQFFRKMSGRIVEADADGLDAPVPFATVTVHDTDFGLLVWSPVDSLYSWFYPFDIRRQQLATVTADARGRFRLWAPRVGLDHFRRWRLERECHLDWLRRPGVAVDDVLSRAAHVVDANALAGLHEMLRAVRPQARTTAPRAPRPPPPCGPARTFDPATRARLAARVGVPAELLAAFEPRRAHGPFLRCRHRYIPEWSTILDAPDLSFEVSRHGDVQRLFDIRWDEP